MQELHPVAIFERLLAVRADEIRQTLNALAAANGGDLSATPETTECAPVFYRYLQSDYLCNTLHLGRWERVYEMHPPWYPDADSSGGKIQQHDGYDGQGGRIIRRNESVPCIVKMTLVRSSRLVEQDNTSAHVCARWTDDVDAAGEKGYLSSCESQASASTVSMKSSEDKYRLFITISTLVGEQASSLLYRKVDFVRSTDDLLDHARIGAGFVRTGAFEGEESQTKGKSAWTIAQEKLAYWLGLEGGYIELP